MRRIGTSRIQTVKVPGFYHSARSRALCGGEEQSEFPQCLPVSYRGRPQHGPTADRWIKHPLRHFERSSGLSRIHAATEYFLVALLDRREDKDRLPVPRVPAIKNNTRVGYMGFL
jgi:hypothetical protein